MTIINPNSISGISSITALNSTAAINLFKADGTSANIIAGVITATTFKGALEVTSASFSSNIDANGDLDVDGHTNLDNVSVAGVSTFSDTVHVGTAVTVLGNGNAIFSGITTFNRGLNIPFYKSINFGSSLYGMIHYPVGGSALEIQALNQIKMKCWDGNSFETAFHISGVSGLTRLGGGTMGSNGSRQPRLDVHGGTTQTITMSSSDGSNLTERFRLSQGGFNFTGLSTHTGNFDLDGDLDVDGHTNLDNVSIAGVVTATTFVGDGDFVELDVDGHTNLDNVSISGVSTFSGKIGVHDGTTGSNGQYLKSIGTGVTWASFPTFRTRQTFTASAGQTTFSFTYNANFIDVFVNGIKLTDSEFTATNGTSVVLAVGCFVGDIVELVGFNTVSTGAGGGGGSLNNIVEDTTPQLGGNLDLFNKSITGTGNVNITGIITATNFIGDGSGLTNVIGSGSGVVVKNSGSNVGTAGTIDFGDNLSVSAISAGIVTITGSAGVTTSQFNVNKLDVSGISTFKGNIDVNADLDVDGHTNLDNVSVAGVTTFGNNITASGTSRFEIASMENGVLDGEISHTNDTDTKIRFPANDQFRIETGGSNRLSVTNTGVSIPQDLDVDGHTNLDNVSIAGVVTATTIKGALEATSASFSSHIDANGDLDVDGHTNLDNVSIAGVVTATSFVGDGSSLTGISGGVTSDGSQNTVGGSNAGDSIVSGGTENTVFGYNAGTAISTGDNNTFFGSRAGRSISTGLQNTGVGYNVMGNTSGTGNAALGQSAGNGILGGSYFHIFLDGFRRFSSTGSANADPLTAFAMVSYYHIKSLYYPIKSYNVL